MMAFLINSEIYIFVPKSIYNIYCYSSHLNKSFVYQIITQVYNEVKTESETQSN